MWPTCLMSTAPGQWISFHWVDRFADPSQMKLVFVFVFVFIFSCGLPVRNPFHWVDWFADPSQMKLTTWLTDRLIQVGRIGPDCRNIRDVWDVFFRWSWTWICICLMVPLHARHLTLTRFRFRLMLNLPAYCIAFDSECECTPCTSW